VGKKAFSTLLKSIVIETNAEKWQDKICPFLAGRLVPLLQINKYYIKGYI